MEPPGRRAPARSGLRAILRALPALGRAIGSSTPQQWLAAVVIVIAVTIGLSTVRIRTASVSLNVSVDLVDVVLAGPARTNESLLADLRWTGGPATLTLPDGRAIHGTDSFVVAVTEPEPQTQGAAGAMAITVAPIDLGEGARLVLRVLDEDERYTVTFARGLSSLELLLPPGARLLVEEGICPADLRHDDGACYRNDRRFASRVVVSDVRGPVHLTGTRVPSRARWAELLPVRALDFSEERLPVGTARALRLSTVRSGLLFVEEGGGQRTELRDGEPLSFGAIEGLLRTVTLAGSSIQLQFDGRGSRIQSGYEQGARSLMPSALEWLANVPWVKAMLAVVVTVIGAAIPYRGVRRMVWRR